MADSLTRRKVYLCKIEASEGVDAVPVPSSDLILLDADINIEVPTEQDMGEGELKGTFGPGQSTTLKQAMRLACSSRVRGLGQGAGALLTPAIHPWLLACGHAVATAGNGTTVPRSATYTPSSALADLKTATHYFYENGLLYKLLGAVNDLSFEASMSVLKAKANGQSKYTPPAAQALPAWAAPAQDFFRMTSALCVVNEAGSPVNIGAFTFDPGTQIEETYETGFHGFRVADRRPTITIDPRAVDGSIADWQRLTNASAIAITATFTNGIGETLVFTANKCVPSAIEPASRAGRQTRRVTYQLKETNGNDQYSLVWTAVL
jgi:hypothetical protein